MNSKTEDYKSLDRFASGDKNPSVPGYIFIDSEKARIEREKRVYRHHVYEIPLMRALGMVMIAVFVLVNDLYILPTPAAWPIFRHLVGIYLVYTCISWAILYFYFKKLQSFHLGMFFLFLDLVFFLPAIYYSGGEKSCLFFLFMVRTADQARTTWKRTLLFAHFSTICYIALLLYLFFYEHRPITMGSSLAVISMIYASNIYLSFISKTAENLRTRMTEAIRVSRDLIQQMERQSASLMKSEYDYRALIEGSIQGICIHRGGVIELANLALARIFGYDSVNEIIGQSYLSHVAESDRERLASYLQAILEGRTAPERFEFTGVRKDKSSASIECMVSTITWQDSSAILATLQDITDRRAAEEALQRAHAKLEDQVQQRTEALQQANKALLEEIAERKRAEKEKESLDIQLRQSQKMEAIGQLAGGVAHDFNNMLSVILGQTELIQAQITPASAISDRLIEIHKAAERSADLTRRLLAFARKQTTTPRLLNLNDAVAGTLQMIQRLIGEDINLVWLPSADLWPVMIDPSQLDQLLTNLCVNARDAISGTGRLTIETANVVLDDDYSGSHPNYVPGDYTALIVSDDGCGMAKEALPHIFEPFYTTKAVGKGTGLGLSTVYGIVRQNNGFINVYSETGKGTAIKIYLPRQKISPESQNAAESSSQEINGNETILLVEDESSILEMIQTMLANLGYTVITANTPGEAVKIVESQAYQINLLLTDVVMPEMNGRQLAATLVLSYPQLKTLYMSGYTANVIAHHGVLDSDVVFIEKPFSSTNLAIKIREALGKK